MKKIMFFVFLLSFSLSLGSVSAFDCLQIKSSSSKAEKDFCKAELAEIEKELSVLLDRQKEQAKQTGTLKGDVDYLSSQIKALQTKVKARSLKIAQLKSDIQEKVSKIDSLSDKIEREHLSLSQLIRNTNDFDNKNFLHLVLSDEHISSFYSDLESYSSIKEAIKDSVNQIRGIKEETELEKKDLETKQDAETDAKEELESAKEKVAKSEEEKKQLLAISKSKELAYQKIMAEKKARANKIRSALFSLRDVEAIPFGTALKYAEEASQRTGVRPAFILAILKQETNLGANVGSCVITNLHTGETKSLSSGKVFTKGIHPTRDLPLLQSILSDLGRDPLSTKVSCPQSVGYGGAMGPAQFIPSTWKIIAPKLAGISEDGVPDPWKPRDAIMASAFLLKGSGADAKTYTAERNSACRYYSGRSCSDPKVRNAFYGDSVMSIAKQIQADIDLL